MQGIASRMRAHYEDCYNDEVVQLHGSDDDSQNPAGPATNKDVQHSVTAQAAVTVATQSAGESKGTTTQSTDALPGPSGNSKDIHHVRLSVSGKWVKAKKRKLEVAKDIAIISTNESYAEKIREQMGRFFLATNTPFTHVEHPEFVKLVGLLRPGYKPPSRKQIANEILDEVHDKVFEQCKNELNG